MQKHTAPGPKQRRLLRKNNAYSIFFTIPPTCRITHRRMQKASTNVLAFRFVFLRTNVSQPYTLYALLKQTVGMGFSPSVRLMIISAGVLPLCRFDKMISILRFMRCALFGQYFVFNFQKISTRESGQEHEAECPAYKQAPFRNS